MERKFHIATDGQGITRMSLSRDNVTLGELVTQIDWGLEPNKNYTLIIKEEHPNFQVGSVEIDSSDLQNGKKVKIKPYVEMKRQYADEGSMICLPDGIRFPTAMDKELPDSRVVTLVEKNGTLVAKETRNRWTISPHMVEQIVESTACREKYLINPHCLVEGAVVELRPEHELRELCYHDKHQDIVWNIPLEMALPADRTVVIEENFMNDAWFAQTPAGAEIKIKPYMIEKIHGTAIRGLHCMDCDAVIQKIDVDARSSKEWCRVRNNYFHIIHDFPLAAEYVWLQRGRIVGYRRGGEYGDSIHSVQ